MAGVTQLLDKSGEMQNSHWGLSHTGSRKSHFCLRYIMIFFFKKLAAFSIFSAYSEDSAAATCDSKVILGVIYIPCVGCVFNQKMDCKGSLKMSITVVRRINLVLPPCDF